jgi:hypothetical protein
MTSEHKLRISSLDPKIGERELRLPNGTRKHIRRLKEEGNRKEATQLRDAAIEQQNSVHQKRDAKLEADSSDHS